MQLWAWTQEYISLYINWPALNSHSQQIGRSICSLAGGSSHLSCTFFSHSKTSCARQLPYCCWQDSKLLNYCSCAFLHQVVKVYWDFLFHSILGLKRTENGCSGCSKQNISPLIWKTYTGIKPAQTLLCRNIVINIDLPLTDIIDILILFTYTLSFYSFQNKPYFLQ